VRYQPNTRTTHSPPPPIHHTQDVPWPFKAFIHIFPFRYSISGLLWIDLHAMDFGGAIVDNSKLGFSCPDIKEGDGFCYGHTGAQVLDSIGYTYKSISSKNTLFFDVMMVRARGLNLTLTEPSWGLAFQCRYSQLTLQTLQEPILPVLGLLRPSKPSTSLNPDTQFLHRHNTSRLCVRGRQHTLQLGVPSHGPDLLRDATSCRNAARTHTLSPSLGTRGFKPGVDTFHPACR
jgi:hypothetical protein